MESYGKRLNYKTTLLVGIGFFTVAIVWSLYNVAVPIYLDGIFAGSSMNKTLVGGIMALDNIFAMLFNPMFGTLSDRTHTKFGRRMPYLLIGIPLSAVFFFIIPFVQTSLWLLIGVVMLMNFFMCMYRTPTVAMMPDLTPPKFRSQANGVINLMGGLGTALAMLAGAVLFEKSEVLPFALGAGALLVTVVILFLFLKEPKEAYDKDVVETEHVPLTGAKRKSLILILMAIFFWFMGYNGFETYLSLYTGSVLGLGKGVSSSLFLISSSVFLLMAIPSGFIGAKIGRRLTIIIGLGSMIAMSLLATLFKDLQLMYFLMVLAGAGWALININSYPMVISLADGKMGRYTGYYYLFSMASAVLAPILLGSVMDILKASQDVLSFPTEVIIFPSAVIFFSLALVCMLFVKHGEVETSKPTNILEVMDNGD